MAFIRFFAVASLCLLLAFIFLPSCSGGGGGGGGDGAPDPSAFHYNALRGTTTPGTVVSVGGKSATAGANGDYEVRDFPDGTHRCTARKPNGSTASRTFTWQAGAWDKHQWNP